MPYYVLQYNPETTTLVSLTPYTDEHEAMDPFEAAEAKYRGGRMFVSLLIADSVQTLRITHPNFFEDMTMERALERVA